MSWTVDAVLCDLDGTLVNSNRVVERTWLTWGARQGVPEAVLRPYLHGYTSRYVVRTVRPDLDDDAVREQAARLMAIEAETIDGLVPVAGAAELLAGLTRWAIVTHSDQRLARVRLAAMGLPVPEVLVTVELMERPKPHPDGYLLAARKLGVRPERCLVIEDTTAGIAAGRAAGAAVVAVRTTMPDSALAEADAIVDDLRALSVEPAGGGLVVSTVEG